MANKTLKILLVNPACLDPRISGDDARVIPIGLFYLGAVLLDNGFHAEILNLAAVQDDPVSVFTARIQAEPPDVIGFSLTQPNRWNAMDCARKARRIVPHVVIVFGGPAPTFLADHLFEVCPEVDAMVRGEGETAFLSLLRALLSGNRDNLSAIAGLSLKQGHRVIHTPAGPLLDDPDVLPHPSDYFVFQHLSMSRGCPGACTFCGSPRFWGTRRVRSHSPEWMVREIETLARKGVTHFFMSDDTFTLDKPRVLKLCRLIREKTPGITWNAISRVDHVDEELLTAMRKAGCIQISYGVESGSEAIRRTLGKPMDRKTLVRAFSMTLAVGILPRIYLIYGSPGETRATIRESVDLIQALRPLSAVFYMLMIFPGTRLYQRAVDRGRVSDAIWRERIEDLPWFEVDERLDFAMVKGFGETLRNAFYERVHEFARTVPLRDDPDLYPFHADFLSRLGMTFSNGEYAADPRIRNQEQTAIHLFRRALDYAPNARAFLGLAMLRQKSRDMDGADALLGKGLRHFPGHPDLTLCMGVNCMNQGRFARALTLFEPFADRPDIRRYIHICHQNLQGTNHDRSHG